MFVWWGVLFALGVLAFLDSFYNFGTLFRQVNSAVFLLVSLGLLARIIMKVLHRTKEKLVDRVAELEGELQAAKRRSPEVVDHRVTVETQPAEV